MPTGYTAQLDENEFDVGRWVTESLPRAFGICVAFRDSGKMTREEILKALEEGAETAGDYDKKKLDKAVHQLEKLRFFQDGQWTEEMERVNTEAIESAIKPNLKSERVKRGHARTRKILSDFLLSDISEITKNIVQFGLEQLDVAKSDEENYIPKIYTDVNDFKKEALRSAQWDVNYHKKEMVETKKRETERLDGYKQVLKDVEEHLNMETRTS